MSSGILAISGGDSVARRVFEEEGRADWAQALPLVLEKLGYLDMDVAGPEALGDAATWERYAAILVPKIPAGAWTPRAEELAASGRAQLLVELPPPGLRGRLGVTSARSAARSGIVSVIDPGLAEAVSCASTLSTARVEPPRSRPIDRVGELDWDRLDVPIEAGRAKRWRVPGWDVQRWDVGPDVTVLAEWSETDGAGRWPAIVRSGALTACSFSMFAYLGQQASVQPFEGPEHLSWPRPAALEAMLMALLDRMHRCAGFSRARVMPWPEGAEWALNVRHDFDRPQSRKQVDRVLAVHARAGTSATWYWRARHLESSRSPSNPRRSKGDGAAVVRRVATTPGHEVALHTERLWESAAEEELRAIERAAGGRMAGSSAHGDPNCFRWQGAPNVLWAERHGMDYTEFISHSHLHPHRFAALRSDGLIEASRVICLPHHESFDRSTTPGDVAGDTVLAALPTYVRAGGLMQILNHPDINVDQLFDLLGRLPVAGRLDWTAAQAVDWWRRTHVVDELRFNRAEDGSLTLASTRGVRGVVVELLDPEGERHSLALDIEPGQSLPVGPATSAHRAIRPTRESRWSGLVGPAFAEAIRAYSAGQGIDVNTPAADSTIATNSTLVPARVEAVRRYLGELGGVTSLEGMRVLDCGAGFGAFAAYLSQARDAPDVTAVDNRAQFADLANRVAERVGLRGFSYEVGDMRTLDVFGDAAFDLVIVNNAFIYLAAKGDMELAVAALARVTRPDGYVCLAHANRWQMREPFTGAPLVHLLPTPIADIASRVAGWQHNHGRVRLIPIPAMVRMMRRGGFDRIESGALRGTCVVRPPRAYFSRFYAVVARRSR